MSFSEYSELYTVRGKSQSRSPSYSITKPRPHSRTQSRPKPKSKPKPFVWGRYGRRNTQNRSNLPNSSPITRQQQLHKSKKLLEEYKKLRQDLKGKTDKHTQNLLWQISQKEADIKNNMNIINEVKSDKRWYPMLIRNPITKKYEATIHEFKPDEYEEYRQSVNQHLLKENMKQQMKEDVINDKIFTDTNNKMWRVLLKECNIIKQKVGKLGTEYYGGSWSANKDIWRFKDGEQRQKYGESLCDILRWYNLHENRKYNDS